VDYVAQTIKSNPMMGGDSNDVARLALNRSLCATFLAAKDWLSTDLGKFRLENLPMMNEEKYQVSRFASAINYSGYGDLWRDLLDPLALRQQVAVIVQQWDEQFTSFRSPHLAPKPKASSTTSPTRATDATTASRLLALPASQATSAIEFSDSHIGAVSHQLVIDPIRLAEYAKAPPPVTLVLPPAEAYPVKNRDVRIHQ
jgi:hypothetical protein